MKDPVSIDRQVGMWVFVAFPSVGRSKAFEIAAAPAHLQGRKTAFKFLE
jgi:hypothetical protein